MSSVKTDRPISLEQLGAELADPPAPLSMADDGTERTITCHDETITQAQLEAAVEAHVPASPAPSPDAVLQDQINGMFDLLIDLGVI